jgi:protein-S-isoprenylcysteine O-methyltransferase Ste14
MDQQGTDMDAFIHFLRMVCGVFALSLFAFLTWNALRASRRPVGESAGPKASWLHSPFYYAAALTFCIVVSVVLWIPLPGVPFPDAIAILGALLTFSGLALALWGRRSLGKMYFVSTNLGAQTLAGQRLVTTGPYAIVRHPMYLGLGTAAFGSLMLYQTWTTVFLIFVALIVVRRALLEEEVLAKTFGAEWLGYRRRVPMLLPRLLHREDPAETKD